MENVIKKSRAERYIENTAIIENYVKNEMDIRFFPEHNICAEVHKHVLEKMGLHNVKIIYNNADSCCVKTPEVDNNLILTGVETRLTWTKNKDKKVNVSCLKRIIDKYKDKNPVLPEHIANMKISILEANIIKALVDNPYDVISSAVKQKYADLKPKNPNRFNYVEDLLKENYFKKWCNISGASKPIKFRITNERLKINFNLNDNKDGWLKSGLVIMKTSIPEVYRSSYIDEKLSKILDFSELSLEVANACENVKIESISTDIMDVTIFKLDMPVVDIATAFNVKG